MITLSHAKTCRCKNACKQPLGQAAAFVQEVSAQLNEAERKAGAARAEMIRRDREAQDAARATARRLAEAQSRADALAEENTSLLLDLNARPTVKERASLARQVEILDANLRKAEAGAGPGGIASAGEAAMAEQATAQSAKLRTTRERIARDKKIAALGLGRAQHVNKAVLVEVVQDACIALDVSDDVTTLPVAVGRLLRAASAVPEMERFVDGVCECVFSYGATLLPANLKQRDPGSVVRVLEHWQEQLHDGKRVEAALSQVHDAVQRRGSQNGECAAALTPPQVVTAVRKLVNEAGAGRAAAAAMHCATEDLQTNSEGVLQQVIGHFQQLFSVPTLEGCIPAMSKVCFAVLQGWHVLARIVFRLDKTCLFAATAQTPQV